MSNSQEAECLTKYQRPWWKNTLQWWPLLVFVLIALFAILLYNRGGKYRVMSGTAERVVETIASLEPARVTRIHVQVGDTVKAGDIIAQLDTTFINAEEAVLRQQIRQSQLEAQLDILTLERQFASALQEAERLLRETQLQYQVDQVEHHTLLQEIARLEPLFKQQLIDAELIFSKKAREEMLAARLKLMPENIDALKQEVEQTISLKHSATVRLEEMKLSSKLGESGQEALKLMQIQREAYTLRAQQNGRIAEIDGRPGDVVEPGIPIVSILVDAPIRIVGFLPESNLSEISVGTRANIYPTVSSNRAGIIPARVTQISPAVYSLPERVSPIRGQVVRGRRVTFALEKETALVPGETVSIEIESSLFGPAPTTLTN